MNEEVRDYDAAIRAAEERAEACRRQAERAAMMGFPSAEALLREYADTEARKAAELARARDEPLPELFDSFVADNPYADDGASPETVRRWFEQTMPTPDEDVADEDIEPEFVIEDEDGEVEFEFRNLSDRSFDYVGDEASRTYTFPEGDELTVHEPVLFHASGSGHHYIVTEDEVVHVIPPTWRVVSKSTRPGGVHMRF
jgi:hypothetical protein